MEVSVNVWVKGKDDFSLCADVTVPEMNSAFTYRYSATSPSRVMMPSMSPGPSIEVGPILPS